MPDWYWTLLFHQTHTEAHSADSKLSASLSSDTPSVANLRLAAAESLEASEPPSGCFQLRSCDSKVVPWSANCREPERYARYLNATQSIVSQSCGIVVAAQPLVNIAAKTCDIRLRWSYMSCICENKTRANGRCRGGT